MCARMLMSDRVSPPPGSGCTMWLPSMLSAASRSGVPKYCTVPCRTTNSRVTGPMISRYVPRGAWSVPLSRYWLRVLLTVTVPVSWMFASLDRSHTSSPMVICRLRICRLSKNTLWNSGPSRCVRISDVSIKSWTHGSSRFTTRLFRRSAKCSTPARGHGEIASQIERFEIGRVDVERQNRLGQPFEPHVTGELGLAALAGRGEAVDANRVAPQREAAVHVRVANIEGRDRGCGIPDLEAAAQQWSFPRAANSKIGAEDASDLPHRGG